MRMLESNSRREPKRYVARLGVCSAILLVGAIMLALGIGMAEDIDERKLKTHAVVTWYDVGAPLGKFLLIRKDSNLCAITAVQINGDPAGGARDFLGDWTGSARGRDQVPGFCCPD